MIFISSNHFSHDIQVNDALSYLSQSEDAELRGTIERFNTEFPEYDQLTWTEMRTWVDTEASGVDIEYMSWVADWIEANTPIRWHDGEPVIDEDGDEEEEDY